MNISTKSLAALSLLTGSALLTIPAGAIPPPPAVILPAPAPAQDALNALAARPGSPLPAGTKLLSIHVADGLATADFSHELRDNFTGGDSEETRTVNAILRTLGQFPTINRVQILVAGQSIESLGGLLSVSGPLPVLRPDPAITSDSTPRRWLHRTPRPAAPSAK